MNRKQYTVLVGIVLASACATYADELPCEIFESKNISAGHTFENGTILHDGIYFPREQYARIDYIFDRSSTKILVEPYLRGCICKFRDCVRFCCPPGYVKVGKLCKQSDIVETKLTHDIRHVDNSTTSVVINNHFGTVHDKSCSLYINIQQYYLMHDGRIKAEGIDCILRHHQYCFSANVPNKTNETIWRMDICYDKEVENCIKREEVPSRIKVLPYIMLISVPFIIATILVYMCVPEIRNIHAIILSCYLATLAVAYTSLASVQLLNGVYEVHIEQPGCSIIAHVIYFAFLSTFFWTNVLSFDLWSGFRRMNSGTNYAKDGGGKWLIAFMMYGWGIAAVFTALVVFLAQSPMIPEEYRPKLGNETCFIDDSKVPFGTKLKYFFLPASAAFLMNVILFACTAWKIYSVQTSLNKIASDPENRLHKTYKEDFVLYIRLFIVMGLSWIMEAVSFFTSPDGTLYWITDVINTLQGVIIFLLFVLKSRVQRLAIRRFQTIFGCVQPLDSTNVTNTTSSMRSNQMAMSTIKKSQPKS